MKIVHINTMDVGGAFQAAYRLHQGLIKQGTDSKFLVLHRYRNNLQDVSGFLEHTGLFARVKNSANYRWCNFKRKKLLRHLPDIQFSLPQSPYNVASHPVVRQADIVHLHWVSGFLDYTTFFRNIQKPVIWTLHDENPFSGGFHYQTYSEKIFEKVDHAMRMVKRKSLENFKNLTIVAPSQWLKNLSKDSELFHPYQHYHIPNGIDTKIFAPTSKQTARKKLGLPTYADIVLFVADDLNDERKGFKYLMEAISLITRKNVVFCAVGKNSLPLEHPQIHRLPFFENETEMASVYNAADIFVIPSVEDNFPNTVLEAMACGIPTVGFSVGGIPEMIDDAKTGLVSRNVESKDLAANIETLLENSDNRNQMGLEARILAEKNYTLENQAAKYIALYKSVEHQS